jgi:hypothetical protein
MAGRASRDNQAEEGKANAQAKATYNYLGGTRTAHTTRSTSTGYAVMFSLYFSSILQLANQIVVVFFTAPDSWYWVPGQFKMHLLKSRLLRAIRMLPTFPNAL